MINFAVLLMMFIIYALTFTVAKFYDITYPYAGVINFVMLTVLLINNINIIKLIKEKNLELYLLVFLIILTGINLLIVKSGKGAFFVPVNFMLIFYLADKIELEKRTVTAFAGLYMIYLCFYLFVAYPKLFTTFENYKYNTNTAATFTIYTLLCAFVLLEIYYDRSPVIGLFMVILLLKGFQLSLWHRARGAFIMLILFMFFKYVMPSAWIKNKYFYGIICLLETVGSLFFVGIYVVVGATGTNFKMPFFYKEVFSGRERIWYELFRLLVNKEKPYMLFTGIGTNFELESFFEKNVHNAMYNFVVIHGIIVFAGILYFIFIRLQSMRRHTLNSRVAMCAMCALTAVFFESYFDVDIIWADYALNLIFLLGVINSFENDEKISGQINEL